MSKLKAAFIFVPNGEKDDSKEYREWVRTPAVDLLVVGVSSYGHAVEAARKAVKDDGCVCIELCAGFGHEGQAMVAAAVDVPVGAVRFDLHPGLNHVSGDKMFK